MVSQAGAMALSGLVPVVHSFACFLSTRPNEQIYNNASEGTKVVYVGSLVGLLPGGPGHSHQSVRDISAFGAMPGMSLIEPCSEHQAARGDRMGGQRGPGVGLHPPRHGAVGSRLRARGRGARPRPRTARSRRWRRQLDRRRAGDAVAGVGGRRAARTGGPSSWPSSPCPGCAISTPTGSTASAGDGPLVCLDNHYTDGGQGDAVLRAAAAMPGSRRIIRLGVESVPVCGTNDEVLRAHGLDAASIADRLRAELHARP